MGTYYVATVGPVGCARVGTIVALPLSLRNQPTRPPRLLDQNILW